MNRLHSEGAMTEANNEIRIDRDKLVQLLQEKSMSQNKLAHYAGVSQSVVSRILSGHRLGVRTSTLLAFARVLRVHPGMIVEDVNSPQLAKLLDLEVEHIEEEVDLDDKVIAQFLDENPEVRAGMAKVIRGRPRALLRLMKAEIENYEESLKREEDP